MVNQALFVKFSAPFLLEEVVSCYLISNKQDNCWQLSTDQSPAKVYPFIFSRHFLRSQHITVTFYVNDSNKKNNFHMDSNAMKHRVVVGYAHLALNDERKEPSKFVVTHEGAAFGEFSAKLSLDLNKQFITNEKEDMSKASAYYCAPTTSYEPPASTDLLKTIRTRAQQELGDEASTRLQN
jgi:hypothetical protein